MEITNIMIATIDMPHGLIIDPPKLIKKALLSKGYKIAHSIQY
jgi:hypothetical protein